MQRGGPPPPPKGGVKPVTQQKVVSVGGPSLSEVLAKKKVQATSSSDSPVHVGFNYFQEKSKTGLVGLSNQGATCYLNSVLQTLYMTPEFRNTLYNWHYNPATDGPEVSSIPLQLQRLFGRLELGEAATTETKDLTKSFGWREADAFRQHDIQELLCKLFEAMEMTFSHGNLRDTNMSPISALFSGAFSDYLQCIENNHKRIRHDPFFEVPLPVGGGIESLQDSFKAWIQPEFLETPWECGKCDAKVPAVKGLKIFSAPMFLVLQLKRFTWDAFNRIKLNDKLSFSTSLDLSPYMDESSEQKDTEYELFSVLIHSGGAMGGHYYAFVQNVINKKWYKFNDASVSEIQPAEIEMMYGGSQAKPAATANPSDPEKPAPRPTPVASKQQFSTSAYMLIYRKATVTPPQLTEAPDYIKEMTKQDNEKYQQEREVFIQKRDNLALEIRFREQTLVLHIDKHRTVKDATGAAWKLAGLEGSHYSVACVRLRKFNPTTGSLGKVLSTAAEDVSKTLEELGFLKNSIWKLEIREPDEQFVVDSGEFKLQVIKVDKTGGTLQKEVGVAIPHRETTLKELFPLVQSCLSTSGKIRIATINPEGTVTWMKELEKELQQDYKLNDGNTLHVEEYEEEDEPSVLVKIFDQINNTIGLQYNLPDTQTNDQNIAIDQRVSLYDLKKLVSIAIALSPQEFKLCKSIIGGEYKDDSKTLKELGLFDGQCIFLKRGEPLQSNQVKVSFVLYNRGDLLSSFIPLGDEVVRQDLSIEELRAQALTYSEVTKRTQDVKCLRLHLKRVNKAGKVLFDGKTLKECIESVDQTTIWVRVLPEPDTIQDNEVVIDLQQWFPSQQERNALIEEMIIPYKTNIGTLKQLIAKQKDAIPLEFLAICRPLSFQLKNKETLSSLLNWFLDESLPVESGDLIFFKDSRDPEVVIEGVDRPSNPNIPTKRVIEEGLKIFTIYDQEGRDVFEKRGILQKENAEEDTPKEEDKN